MTHCTLVTIRGPNGAQLCGPTLARALLVGLRPANAAALSRQCLRTPWFRTKTRPSAANTVPEDRR